MIIINKEELMVFGFESANGTISGDSNDQGFKIETTEDDNRNFENCHLYIITDKNKVSDMFVINLENEEYEEEDAPELTKDEENSIRDFVNEAIQVSLEAKRELA